MAEGRLVRLHRGSRSVLDITGRQLPLFMVIYDSFLFAVVAVLCVRDDGGRPAVIALVARNLPLGGGPPTPTRLVVVATALLVRAVAIPIAVFGVCG